MGSDFHKEQDVDNLVEKPYHVDDARMNHISDHALLDSFRINDRKPESITELLQYLRKREEPRPAKNTELYARTLKDFHLHQSVLEEATELLDEQVDFLDKSRGRSRLYGFHYLGWMKPLIQAYVLTKDDQFVHGFSRLICQWYETRDEVKGDWPNLDVIWYSLGLASRSTLMMEALDSFKDNPAFDDRSLLYMLKSLIGAARWLVEEHDEFRHGNWQVAGCSTLVQLALMFPECFESGDWLDIGWERLEDHLELDIYADGGHYERSPSYHTMVLNCYRSAVMMVARSAEPRHFRNSDKFRKSWDWLFFMNTPLGCAPEFNDSGTIWVGPQLAYASKLFNCEDYLQKAYQFSNESDVALALAEFYGDEKFSVEDRSTETGIVAQMNASQRLPASKYIMMRSEENQLQMSINYGPYVGHELEPHSHHDALDFVIYGMGEALAIEGGGPPSYDDPGYYSWYQAATSHNMVVVNDSNVIPEDKDGELERWNSEMGADLFAARHNGYKRNFDVGSKRIVIFVKPYFWFVMDRLEPSGSHLNHLEWTLYSPGKPEYLQDRVLFKGNHGGLVVLPMLRPGMNLRELSGTAVVPTVKRRENEENREGEVLREHTNRIGGGTPERQASYTRERRTVDGIGYALDSPDTVTFANVLLPVSMNPSFHTLPAEAYTLEQMNTVDSYHIHGGANDWYINLSGEVDVGEPWSSSSEGCMVQLCDKKVQQIDMWGEGVLAKHGQTILSGNGVDHLELRKDRKERFTIDAVMLRKGDITLHTVEAKGLSINGVQFTTTGDEQQTVLSLPGAGKYRIHIFL